MGNFSFSISKPADKAIFLKASGSIDSYLKSPQLTPSTFLLLAISDLL